MNESTPMLGSVRKFHALFGALALLVSGCAGDVSGSATDDGQGNEATSSRELALDSRTSRDVEVALSRPRHPVIDWDRVYTFEHFVRLAPGRKVFVRESFTLNSWLRYPRRAVLMAAAVPVTDEFLNIPIDGYRMREMLAQRGFFAFTMDLEGAGQSNFPSDGFSVTYESQTELLLEVIDTIRRARGVRRVDLYGEGEAAGVAAQTCADARRTRSCTLASLFYATGTEFFDATFLSPGFRELVLNAPQGYLPLGPEAYFNVLSASSPEISDWVHATQPGTYSMGLIAEHFAARPAFDVTQANVPGLVIRGELDPNALLADSLHLADDYGSATGAGPARVVEISGAKLLPRLEPSPKNEDFWKALVEFLDP